jgi:hypothetical protein
MDATYTLCTFTCNNINASNEHNVMKEENNDKKNK